MGMSLILGKKQLDDFIKLLYSKVGVARNVTEVQYSNIEDIPLKKIDLFRNMFSVFLSELGTNSFNAPGHNTIRKLIGDYTPEYLFALANVVNRENLEHPIYENLFEIALFRKYLDTDPMVVNASEIPSKSSRNSVLRLVHSDSRCDDED